MNKRWLALAALVVMSLIASGTLAARQTTQTDPIQALLTEVHALRVSMEHTAAITPRVQLTLARLNIEEQRIAQLASQLDRVRQQLGEAVLATRKATDELADVERRTPTIGDERERRTHEAESTYARRQLAERSTVEQQLRAREAEAAQMLATEQSRWLDLNSRLDELERLLGPVR